jgi:Fe-S cluster assembly iron-binding protein IscA
MSKKNWLTVYIRDRLNKNKRFRVYIDTPALNYLKSLSIDVEAACQLKVQMDIEGSKKLAL